MQQQRLEIQFANKSGFEVARPNDQMKKFDVSDFFEKDLLNGIKII